jgi:uncharacterized protein (UPF0332 family)
LKSDSLESSLVRKGERAMRSARMSLREGDPDSAVNRAYYAMFNVARAALLNSGVPEGDLPRTHRGVIEAFRNHAVQTGRVDAELASTLSRTESLRLKADYPPTSVVRSPLDPGTVSYVKRPVCREGSWFTPTNRRSDISATHAPTKLAARTRDKDVCKTHRQSARRPTQTTPSRPPSGAKAVRKRLESRHQPMALAPGRQPTRSDTINRR